MRLPALIHLIQAVQALCRCERTTVLGSAALLVPFPELGDEGGPLRLTRDADLLLTPTDESIASMVHEALGRGSLFERTYGYHADVLRPAILTSLPRGWQDRAQVEPQTGAQVIAAADLCAVKLLAGRSKDLAVVGHLLRAGLVERAAVRDAIAELAVGERAQAATWRRLGALAEQATLDPEKSSR